MPTVRAEGLYAVSNATPLLFVTADPTEIPSTVKPTVAPDTAAPPIVLVKVAEIVTGPVEPNDTEAGLGAASVSVVPTLPLKVTVSLAEEPNTALHGLVVVEQVEKLRSS